MEKISKLTPILYKKNETDFNHNGLGKLTGMLTNEIEEVLNGQFEALFKYPANGRLADKIDNKMLIKAKPNTKDEAHVFRIYDYDIDTIAQTYLIYARSKNIDDLGGNMVLDVHVRDQAPTQAWNMAASNALDPVNVRFESDITTPSSVHWERRNLLSIVAGEQGSMIQYWGGEIKHGNGWLWLYRRRGQDNVTTVRHGKNLEGLTATYSTKGLVTAIVPYYVKRGIDEDDKSIYGNTAESQYVNNYPRTYYDTIEYNDEDLGLERDEEPENGWSDSTIRNALNNVAKNYFNERDGIDLPSINMEIRLEDISKTKEYAHFKDFEQIEIGDTITVYSKKFNLHLTAKVRRVVYNGLTDMNTVVEVGTVSRSIYDDYRDLVDNRVNESANRLQEGIDHAQTSANGKNTNYFGTADPNEAGLVAQGGDPYFRQNGQERELWIFRNGMWHREIDDLTGERIKEDVAAAAEEAESARTEADRAVNEISTAVNNAGFTTLDDTITSIQTNASTAISNAQSALGDASSALNTAKTAIGRADSAISSVSDIDIRVDEVEGTLGLKADAQTVDTISGIVDTHTVDIQANADALALKANQDTVDTLAGTVQSLGTEFDIVAGQVNSRVWNTDIESAIDGIEVGGRNLVRNSDFSQNLDFYDGANVSFENITSEGFILDSVNYISSYIQPNVQLSPGEYTVQIWYENLEGHVPYLWNTGTDGVADTNYPFEEGEGVKVAKVIFKTEVPTKFYRIRYAGSLPENHTTGRTLIYRMKIERGNKATDWTEAPEDTLARFDHIETEWTQTFDTFSQTVSSIDGRVTAQQQDISSITTTIQEVQSDIDGNTTLINETVDTVETHTQTIATIESGLDDKVEITEYNTLVSTVDSTIQRIGNAEGDITQIEANISGLQTTVADKANQSQVTQLSNLLNSTVEDVEGHSSRINQLSNNINLRVTTETFNQEINEKVDKDRAITQINLSQDTALIQADKIMALGDVVVDGKLSITDEFIAANAQIDGAKIGNATISSAKIVDLDVNKISGLTSNFVQSYWNSATGGSVRATGDGILTTASDGSQTYIQDGIVGTRNPSGATIGQLGYFYNNNSPWYTMQVSNGSHFQINMSRGAGNLNKQAFYIMDGGLESYLNTDRIYMNPAEFMTVQGTMNIQGNLHILGGRTVYGAYEYQLAYGGGIKALSSNSTVQINSSGGRVELRTANQTVFRVDSTYGYMFRNLSMEGNDITNQSDLRLKHDIADTELNSLEAIKSWNFVDYYWNDPDKRGQQFGLIAQHTNVISLYDEERDLWGINSSKQIMMNSHAIQQLALKEENTNKIASQALQATETNTQKIERLEKRIEELEGVA